VVGRQKKHKPVATSRPSEELGLPIVGQQVYWLTGEHLGEVAALGPDSFHVTISRGPSVCLARSAVFTSVPGALTLICDGTGLNRYVLRKAAPGR
jgi:hypothetical protein